RDGSTERRDLPLGTARGCHSPTTGLVGRVRMGRHSQPDRGEGASESLATGEPAWEHWWEKTGSQPRIVDPPIEDRPSRLPLVGLPPPQTAPPAPAGFREVEPLTHP